MENQQNPRSGASGYGDGQQGSSGWRGERAGGGDAIFDEVEKRLDNQQTRDSGCKWLRRCQQGSSGWRVGRAGAAMHL
jgi:hypothetical protein